MPVQDTHKQYDEHKARWERARAAVRGKDAVLDLIDALPLKQTGEDKEQDNSRLEAYKARAHYYNATGRTLRGLLGLAKSKPSVIELPEGLEYLKTNANGAGVSLLQQALKSASDVIQTGRSGLLVSYPQVTESITIAQKREQGIYARILRVRPEDIINWKTSQVGSEVKLSLLVIKETYEDNTDKFTAKEYDQYRVLELVEGKCFIEIHRKGPGKDFDVSTPIPVMDASGTQLDFIPFQFIGAENNDHEVDDAPLYDIAETNLAHFRNSADFEEASHLAKELTLVVSGLDENWYKDVLKEKICVGTMSALPLNEGATATMLQPAETMMAERGMAQKENHMRALGAQLIERGTANKTATEANNDAAAEHSVLSLVAENDSDAYRQALEWVALMEGVQGDIEFQLPSEYVTDTLDAQELTALVGAWQSGAITTEAKNNKLRRAGIERHDKTDEEIAADIESTMSFEAGENSESV